MLPLVLALLMNTGSLPSFFLMGVCGALALMLFGAFISVLHRQPARTITFDLSGVREEVGDRVYDHGWQWIEAVVEDDDSITLHCKKPMRSFTVVSSAHDRVLVIDKRSTDVAELKKLLQARGD